MNGLKKFVAAITIFGMAAPSLHAQNAGDTTSMEERPVQFSFFPGLSSNGQNSPRIANHFSLNILGGKTGGVNGAEIGGLFNVTAKNVEGFQVAGIFNSFGGNVNGVQIAGITNFANNAGKTGTTTGVQIAGISNRARNAVSGLQIAGIVNHTQNTVSGMQIGGILNYAKRLDGLQIGLVNIADSSNGFSIGLINISRNGYYKFSVYTNEIMNTNVALKTGKADLYCMIIGGMNISDSAKIYSFGAGVGRHMNMERRLSFTGELSSQYLYLGSWKYFNLLNKISLNLNLRLHKNISLFAGPAVNVYYGEQSWHFQGYKKQLPSGDYHPLKIFTDVRGWIGWNAGITFL